MCQVWGPQLIAGTGCEASLVGPAWSYMRVRAWAMPSVLLLMVAQVLPICLGPLKPATKTGSFFWSTAWCMKHPLISCLILHAITAVHALLAAVYSSCCRQAGLPSPDRVVACAAPCAVTCEATGCICDVGCLAESGPNSQPGLPGGRAI